MGLSDLAKRQVNIIAQTISFKRQDLNKMLLIIEKHICIHTKVRFPIAKEDSTCIDHNGKYESKIKRNLDSKFQQDALN